MADQGRETNHLTAMVLSFLFCKVGWRVRRDNWLEDSSVAGGAPRQCVSSLWRWESSGSTKTKGEPWTMLLPANTEHCAYYVQGAAPGPLHMLSHLILATAL